MPQFKIPKIPVAGVVQDVGKASYEKLQKLQQVQQLQQIQRTESLSPTSAFEVARMSPEERRRNLKAKSAAQVYDFQRWQTHRSGWMSLFYIMTLFNSHTMQAIRWPLLWVLLTSTLVAGNFTLSGKGRLPWWLMLPSIPSTMGTEPLALTSVAISMLLVFRTNASYGRFDDARKLWGLMLNRSRDIVRQAISFFPEQKVQSKATLARWTIVFTKTLLCHLQSVCVLHDEIESLLSPEEMQIMTNAKHPTVVAIQVLSQLIQAADITEFQKLQMFDNVTNFQDILGGCERILKTPIPVAYTRHTVRCVMLWLTFFPYLIFHKLGWFVVPVAFLTAICLLGINAIGTDIEEPFSILPLESISERARMDITELINLQSFLKGHLKGAQDRTANEHVFNMPAPQPAPQQAESSRDTRLTMDFGTICVGPQGRVRIDTRSSLTCAQAGTFKARLQVVTCPHAASMISS